MWQDLTPDRLVRLIADDLPVGIWVARAPGGELLYANRMFEEIMGLGARVDVARGAYAEPYGIHTPAGAPYPESLMPFVRALEARQTVTADDLVIHRPDGRRVNVRAEARPILAPDGDVSQVIIAFCDITAEVRAQAERAGAEQRLRAVAEELQFVLEHMSEFVYRHDAGGNFGYASPALQRVLGYTPAEWVGHYSARLTEHPMNVHAVEATERALRTGCAQPTYRLEVQHKAGHRLVLEINEQPYFEDGRVAGVVGVARDVTERIRAEAEVERLNRDLTATNQELQTLLYAASHDLRTPLVGIEGFSTEIVEVVAALRDIPAEAPPAARAPLLEDLALLAGRVGRAARRLDGMLAALLQLSRLNRVPLSPQEVDMQALVGRVAEALAWQLERGRMSLATGELPPCRGDAVQLERVFTNLVDNAIKHRRVHDPGRVEIAGERVGERVVYTVTDQGPGIPAAHRDRIFELFNRLEPGRVPGEGLGLAIAQRVVGRHGGRIWVDPDVVEGTRMCVELPAAPATVPPD